MVDGLGAAEGGPEGGSGRFAAALRDLASCNEVDGTLQLAVELATELVGGCDIADIMFIRARGVTTPVSTDPLAIELDKIQEATDEGPCLQAGHDQVTVVAADLGSDPRWPAFGPDAAERGIRSALSFPLFLHRTDDDRFGVLNLYSRETDAFDAQAVERGEVFAAQCAAALAAAIAREGLQSALESRDVIGQAKGILMQRHRWSALEALDRIREVSQRDNVKLRDVARHVAETGELP
ncbi:GAF and ANTAR domain-containing protein [Egicoccus sp. AB-alg6-2]|uniref:GAF and ANTAR domain-containing protein n=1 Tax=Egicoccus sp. AB-alg6-2 TaxID=3242692 RepID=UPI00359D4E74